jgi:CBS domain-containing protein
MNAKDIMTSPVITVAPHTLVTELAALLCERRISAVPVMDAERLAGIVSEADLLHRYELGTDCALCGEPWWLEVFSADRSSDDYVKSHARYVRDIMTRDVATVSPATPLAEIATLLERRRIKRVPVVDQGRLAGIVSRSDLVRALAAARRGSASPDPLADEAIETSLIAELRRQSWWLPDLSSVSVEDGVVTFGGIVEFEHQRSAARVAAETIPGVRGVEDRRLPYGSLHPMV